MGLLLRTFQTADEASATLKADHASRYLGGGTLLVRRANEGDISFSSYVRVVDKALSEISIADGRVRVGASVTMAQILASTELSPLGPAARAVGGPAIRNMATVGGNLHAPPPYGDFAVALIALGALVDFDGREVPVTDFLAGRDGVFSSGVIRSVSFALPAEGSFRFAKVSRVKPKGTAVVTIAAVIEEDSGVITSARVAYGCLADRPIRAKVVEGALVGKERSRDGIAEALAVAHEGTTPITDAVASAWYRGEVLPVHLARLLLG
ncbi:FAD binding domain-containing protein [Sinorhizobium sp. BG8]|uniref:FAD binding domain-containing protein n=1 Tax=Sinorhizobium sp. BG8 TaxID=2613773 RepID=UPI00193E01B0|nr:FAD binding domain-containing protein [Sinorhizobium sp. BG8]QRM57406.1 xanthine dehydrogenase family protein subunit M [Sinorhizobium sp. BG8]